MKLVVLKAALSATKGITKYEANYFYRCMESNGGYIVFGEYFDKREFDSLFMDAIEWVKNHWKQIGLLGENDKPISKTAFMKLADIHVYGYRRKNSMKIWYFRNDRNCIYGFYPMSGTVKQNQLECYQWYLDILNGDYEPLDDKDVCFGNCGIPLSYSKLRIN